MEKSLFLSNGGGITRNAAQLPIHDDVDDLYGTYVSMAVRPDNPDQNYANLEGVA